MAMGKRWLHLTLLVWILAPRRLSCVTLEQLYFLAKPQFPSSVKWERERIFASKGL